MASFSVRAARPGDTRGLLGLLGELLGRPLEQDVATALAGNLLRVLSTPGSSLLVAEGEDGMLLGFASLWTRWGLFDEAPTGVLDMLVVSQAFQSSAVPYALVEQALGACQAMGCARVEFIPGEASLVPEGALARFGFTPLRQRYVLEVR